jgi:HEPN domain-containing protein
MPKPPEVRDVVHQWLRKADHDLLNASSMLELEERCPTDTVCFHAQQCVEKCLKACLVHEGIRFPRHHDIAELIALLPTGFSIDLSPEEQERLTDYATVARYPGDYDDVSLDEASHAVAVSRRIREAVGNTIAAADEGNRI